MGQTSSGILITLIDMHKTKNKKHCIEMYLNEKHGTSDHNEKGFQTSTERTTTKRHQDAEKLMRTAYMVVKEHLPFTKYPSMCELQRINGLVLGENYLTNKACGRFAFSIATDITKNVYNDICDARFVSILSDGSTDKGILKEEIVYARYVKNGKP